MFNRSVLLTEDVTPNVDASAYYQDSVTNHYARIVHGANTDGRGYAFSFDDFMPTGGEDQSGAVQDGAPQLLTVTVGGKMTMQGK